MEAGIPGFVMGTDDGKNVTKKVLGILPLDTYLVQFKDADGKEAIRVVMQPKGTKTVFNLQEKISGIFVATQASSWFRDSFNQKLGSAQDVKSV